MPSASAQVAPSREVGLHAQLFEYDVSEDDGMNVGQNPEQTACMAGGPSCPNTVSYTWYAGRIAITPGVKDGSNRTAIPVEYGTINLSASDPIKGGNKGLIGALIIEPKGAVWAEAGERGADGLYTLAAVSIREPGVGGSTCSKDPDRTCSADSGCQVTLGKFCSNTVGTQFQKSCNSNRDCRGGGGSCVTVSDALGTCEAPVGPLLFRDFVAIHQDDVNLLYAANGGTPLPTVSQEEEPKDSGGKGINYRTDPIWHRLGKAPVADAKTTRTWDYTDAFSSKLGEPQTPIWTARVGDDIRIRILKPAGHNRNSTRTLQGHLWPMYPYSDAGPATIRRKASSTTPTA